MYVLFTDETNQIASQEVRFFIYGGLFCPILQLPELCEEIEAIRLKAGLLATDEFKFDTRSRPAHVDFVQWNEAKRKLMLLCANNKVKFMAYLVLHNVAATQGMQVTLKYALNTIMYRYNAFLRGEQGDGICAIDALPSEYGYKFLTELHQQGVEIGGNYVRLPQVKLFSYTCVGASYMCSAVDIVLGAFRYWVNHPDRPATLTIEEQLRPLLWGAGTPINALEQRGIMLRPVTPWPLYAQDYAQIRTRITAAFCQRGLLPEW